MEGPVQQRGGKGDGECETECVFVLVSVEKGGAAGVEGGFQL